MRKTILILASLILISPIIILANGETIGIENPLQAGSFEAIINGLIDFVFKIAIVVAPLMIVIGGFLFLTSAGDVQKVATARRLITWAAIGFMIVLLAKAAMSMLESLLGTK